MANRFLFVALFAFVGALSPAAVAKKAPPEIKVTELLPTNYRDSVVPFESDATFDDRWSWADGKHIYLSAIKAEARVGVLSIPLQSQSDELKRRVEDEVRGLGYTVVTSNSFVEEGLFGKAVFTAWGLVKIEANKEIIDERIALWHQQRPLADDWWSRALLSAAAPFLETEVLQDWVKDADVCRASGGDWLYEELLKRGNDEGKALLEKVLKFHSESCPRERAAMALVSAGHTDMVEEQLASLPEKTQQKLRTRLMDM